MRYILDSEGYIYDISFVYEIECDLGTCTEYTGTIPDGYETIEEWFNGESNKLNAWKIVDGDLVFDNAKYKELQSKWDQEEKDNSYVIHKELEDLNNAIEILKANETDQYKTENATGKVISINNVKQIVPTIKITNINPYSFSKIDLLVTGKNMLKNEASTQTINGINFTQNNDRSININGTSTAAIEYNIAGTSSNTSAFLCFKKGLNYYLSSNGYQIKMYYYDGTDRTEIYSGTGGSITFSDSDKLVTQIVLSIPNNKTINNVTIYPQLEYGSSASTYEPYKSRITNIDFSEYIEEGLFPRNDLYPSDDLYPSGTIVDYLLITNEKTIISLNGEETELNKVSVNLFNGNDTIYTLQDTNIEMEYCINILNVDDLDYMRGKSTSSNKFKILPDGSIEANNGTFVGGKLTLNDTASVITSEGNFKIINSNVNRKLIINNLGMYVADENGDYSGSYSSQHIELYQGGEDDNNSVYITPNGTSSGDYRVPAITLSRQRVSQGTGYTRVSTEGIVTNGTIKGSNIPNIDTGTCTLNSSSWVTVSFNKEFEITPVVVLTPVTTVSGIIAGKVTEVTKTGFKALIGGTVTGNIIFNWIAIN